MELSDFAFVGWIAATCTSIGFIPQIIKGFKTKKLDDVSWGMLWVTFTGITCWLFYGIVIKDVIIIVANVFTDSTLILLISMKQLYKKGGKRGYRTGNI